VVSDSEYFPDFCWDAFTPALPGLGGKSFPTEKFAKMPDITVEWGLSSVGRASRSQKYFGSLTPKAPNIPHDDLWDFYQ